MRHAPQATEPGMAGLLLTGGASRRMGVDKASLPIDGVPGAARILGILARVAAPVLEVGPGVSGAPSVLEDEPGSGPLAALAAGGCELARLGHGGPALVVACDLVLLEEAVLRMLARWPGGASVVPVVEGRPQPLCARWAPAELEAARELFSAGARSLRPLCQRPGVILAPESDWPSGIDRRALADADTPEDLIRLGFGPDRAGRAPPGGAPGGDRPVP